MLCVGDGVTDDRLEEAFENTTGLFVDHGGDTLDTTTSGKTADGRLGDTLDIVSQDLAVSLRASFAKSFSTFSSARHISKWLGVLLLCGGMGCGRGVDWGRNKKWERGGLFEVVGVVGHELICGNKFHHSSTMTLTHAWSILFSVDSHLPPFPS